MERGVDNQRAGAESGRRGLRRFLSKWRARCAPRRCSEGDLHIVFLVQQAGHIVGDQVISGLQGNTSGIAQRNLSRRISDVHVVGGAGRWSSHGKVHKRGEHVVRRSPGIALGDCKSSRTPGFCGVEMTEASVPGAPVVVVPMVIVGVRPGRPVGP